MACAAATATNAATIASLTAPNDYSLWNLFGISFLTTQFIFINFLLFLRPTSFSVASAQRSSRCTLVNFRMLPLLQKQSLRCPHIQLTVSWPPSHLVGAGARSALFPFRRSVRHQPTTLCVSEFQLIYYRELLPLLLWLFHSIPFQLIPSANGVNVAIKFRLPHTWRPFSIISLSTTLSVSLLRETHI